MIGVKAEIRRFLRDDQPNWVEFALIDAQGREWTFHEKVPVITSEWLDAESGYPRPCTVACTIVERRSIVGLDVVEIETEQPWGLESVTGQSRFMVRADQLATLDWFSQS